MSGTGSWSRRYHEVPRRLGVGLEMESRPTFLRGLLVVLVPRGPGAPNTPSGHPAQSPYLAISPQSTLFYTFSLINLRIQPNIEAESEKIPPDKTMLSTLVCQNIQAVKSFTQKIGLNVKISICLSLYLDQQKMIDNEIVMSSFSAILIIEIIVQEPEAFPRGIVIKSQECTSCLTGLPNPVSLGSPNNHLPLQEYLYDH